MLWIAGAKIHDSYQQHQQNAGLGQQPVHGPLFSAPVRPAGGRIGKPPELGDALLLWCFKTHFALWIVAQSAKTIAHRDHSLWIDFMTSLINLWKVLDNLPVNWLAQGSNALDLSTQQKQWIPAEAPLELVTQIYLLVHDRRKPLRNPGKIMALLIFLSNLEQNVAPNSSNMISR